MKRSLLVLLSAAALFAQPGPGGPGGPGRFGPGEGMQPPADAIKAYLNLTDSQVTSLRTLQTNQRNAMQTAMNEIGTKERALRERLQAGSTDAPALGAALIEIENLRKRLQTLRDGFEAQALAVLSAEQRSRLKNLSDAAALQDEIRQATMLNLLDPPAGPGFGGPGGPGLQRMPGPFGR